MRINERHQTTFVVQDKTKVKHELFELQHLFVSLKTRNSIKEGFTIRIYGKFTY